MRPSFDAPVPPQVRLTKYGNVCGQCDPHLMHLCQELFWFLNFGREIMGVFVASFDRKNVLIVYL